MSDFKGFGQQKDEPNVTKNRNVYIGGSDLPAVLGISKYKNQYELALEKTGIVERPFQTNEYIQFGNVLEPRIREYINAINNTNFQPSSHVDEDRRLRSNTDGFDQQENLLLEIKTHGKTPRIKDYEVQIQMYLWQTGAEAAWLALYERPKDFDIEFDKAHLKIIEVERDEDYIQRILNAVELFWVRCEQLKQNLKMTEAEFMEVKDEN